MLGIFSMIQSEVICYFMCCVFCIHKIQMMFMMQNTFILMITVNKTHSNHVLYDSVVLLNIFIEPWCISTSSFHGCAEVFNKKVSNIYLFLQIWHPHQLSQVFMDFLLFYVVMMKIMIMAGVNLYGVGNI